MGVSDEKVEGSWVYTSSGLPLTYFHWNGPEPNGRTGENCVKSYSSGFWWDVSCSAKSITLCEKLLID